MGNTNRPALAQEDYDLMIRISKHNFIDMNYIYKFYKKGCKQRTVYERILQLERYEYLSIVTTFVPPEFSIDQKAAYKIVALGSSGVSLMKDMGISVDEYYSTLKNASPYRMYHQAQLTMICDCIEEAYKNSNSKFEVVEILNEKQAYLEEGGQPDALILFRAKEDVSNKNVYIIVFIELERSYASLSRIKNKLLSYSNVVHENLYGKKFGVSLADQRVLFVAQTEGQYETLKDKIVSIGESEVGTLVAKYHEVCKKPEEEIYENPKTVKKHKLLSNIY